MASAQTAPTFKDALHANRAFIQPAHLAVIKSGLSNRALPTATGYLHVPSTVVAGWLLRHAADQQFGR
jgi:hypothetical protein